MTPLIKARPSSWVCCFLLGLEPISALSAEWEKVIDFGDSGYSETGNAWRTYPFGPAVGGSYRYLSHFDSGRPRVGKALWTTTIPYSGTYRVQVSYRITENRTRDANYELTDGNGDKHSFVLNQGGENSGSLHIETLGEFVWQSGQTARVILDGTDDNDSDGADAVRWKLVAESEPPIEPPVEPPVQPPVPEVGGVKSIIPSLMLLLH